MTSPRRPHRPVRLGGRLALAALVALAAVGCGVSGSDPSEGGGGSTDGFDPADTELVVAFQDSSVPPEYHRSYELTVEDQEAHVVVDSYGDVIHDETVEIPDDVWGPLVAGLDDQLAEIDEPEGGQDGCTGGTSISVAITSGDAEFARDVEDCSSDRDEEIAEQLDEVLAPVYDAVDLESLIATE